MYKVGAAGPLAAVFGGCLGQLHFAMVPLMMLASCVRDAFVGARSYAQGHARSVLGGRNLDGEANAARFFIGTRQTYCRRVCDALSTKLDQKALA